MWIEIAPLSRAAILWEVTPCAGVWIEIQNHLQLNTCPKVTPCAGVWIEMQRAITFRDMLSSLPVRECGLKLFSIKIFVKFICHSLCGSVD